MSRYVIEPIPAYGYPGITNLDRPVIAPANQAVKELAASMEVPTANGPIELGSVKGRVLLLAKDINVDLIIVGSHGRHGLGRLLGSSTIAIVQGSKGDVMVLRPYDR